MNPSDVARQAVPRRSMSDHIYAELRQQIISMKRPPGQRLNIPHLSAEFQTSGTPLREALNRLTAERLVLSEAYRGFSVCNLLSKEQLIDLLEVRLQLEELAVRKAAARGIQHLKGRFELHLLGMQAAASNGEWDVDLFMEHDRGFHLLLIEATGNDALRVAYESLQANAQIVRLYASITPSNDSRANLEHGSIYEAVAVGDAAGAVKEIRSHIATTRQALSEFWAREAGR